MVPPPPFTWTELRWRTQNVEEEPPAPPLGSGSWHVDAESLGLLPGVELDDLL